MTAFKNLPYRPQQPKSYLPAIGLIGCGGITETHLKAYQQDGYTVAAFADLSEENAKARRDKWFPEADVYTDHRALLARPDIEVVDIATHPKPRVGLIREALEAGKHVLSQKPFVLDLAIGEELVALARDKGLRLAVNQNGRWSPPFSLMRESVTAGLVGRVLSIDCCMQLNHTWIKGTPFEAIHHAILYDLAIHWFDFFVSCLPGQSAESVSAHAIPVPETDIEPPMLTQAIMRFPRSTASLVMSAATPKGGNCDVTTITGTGGVVRRIARPGEPDAVVYTPAGGESESLAPEGGWFPDGFRGTMGELLCSIEEDRPCQIDAAANLDSLALCFAAMASADRGGEAVRPGSVRSIG
ncbi:MAG: Gfo/Idh/MocA family protein [Opitutales bacterium]